MVYNTVSSKAVIAKVLRDTRMTDSSYIDDMYEWLLEGMKQMETQIQLTKTSEIVEIKAHVGAVPCGLINLKAVEYNGTRLRKGADQRDLTAALIASEESTQVFEPAGRLVWDGSELSSNNTILNTSEYYTINPNYLQTSIEEGLLLLHFEKMDLDEDGYPNVPDNVYYINALYWYILTQLIGTGFKHPVFTFVDTEQRWEREAGRAIAAVSYPDIDGFELLRQVTTRLVPEVSSYQNFFINSENPEQIYK